MEFEKKWEESFCMADMTLFCIFSKNRSGPSGVSFMRGVLNTRMLNFIGG